MRKKKYNNLMRIFLGALMVVLAAACQKENPPSTEPVKWAFTYVGDNNTSCYADRITDYTVPEAFESTVIGPQMYGLTLDRMQKKLYYFDGTENIYRCNYDFSQPELVGNAGRITGPPNQNAVAGGLISYDRRFYRHEDDGLGMGALVSSKLDGSDRKHLFEGFTFIGMVGISRPAEEPYVYFAMSGEKKIYRGNADGTGTLQLLADLSSDTTFTQISDLEVYKNKLYVGTDKGIYEMSPEGRNMKRIFAETAKNIARNGMYLGEREQKLYWISADPDETGVYYGSPYLYEGKIDGTGAIKLLEQFSYKANLSVDISD
ncbi:hypothetical protein [Desertivirga xinjiangensis]|uniref:hypothetical protein n=1 Tax=Desertivirga xinjiangensis TaxID=539206 RepID=UPI00210A4AC9|nr:hypothetical protein [Pedobacter xinjiangensis]